MCDEDAAIEYSTINEGCDKMGKKMFYIRLAIYITVFAIALICITGFKAEEKILVIVPHPDDDVLSCAGVIRATVNNGKDVRIMYVTNGDYGNIAELRCMEIIKAMKVLGVKKDEIYYLGYGDSEVLQNAYNAKNNPKQVFSSKPGYTQTYGWEHLKLDYHYEKYDAHASYCRQDILSDIQGIIGDFMPDDIYMPSPMEEHPDHSKSSEFVTEAVLNIKASEDINTLERYEPVIHEYMMYKAYLPPYDVDIDAEPVPISDKDADIDNTTIYRWNDRESVPVPDEMMAPISSGKNLKAEALNI